MKIVAPKIKNFFDKRAGQTIVIDELIKIIREKE